MARLTEPRFPSGNLRPDLRRADVMRRQELSSRVRTDFRKSETKRLRRENGIPATVYGRGEDSISLALEAGGLAHILKSPGGRLSVIDLKVEGEKSKKKDSPVSTVMIQEIQRNPITLQILHVDLHRVRMDEAVHAKVPLVLVGEAPGIKQGGILEHFTRELDIKALPDHIPSHINVDVSHLELGHSIHVADVQLPPDVELLHATLENVVAMCRLPIVRVEEVAAPEAEVEEGAEAPAEEAKEEAAEES